MQNWQNSIQPSLSMTYFDPILHQLVFSSSSSYFTHISIISQWALLSWKMYFICSIGAQQNMFSDKGVRRGRPISDFWLKGGRGGLESPIFGWHHTWAAPNFHHDLTGSSISHPSNSLPCFPVRIFSWKESVLSKPKLNHKRVDDGLQAWIEYINQSGWIRWCYEWTAHQYYSGQ